MSTVLIPARLNSTRLPGKVLADICGKPVIIRVAEQCLKSCADEVIVVTDTQKVFDIVRNAGIKAVMSDPEIPTGTDRIAVVASELNDDIIINVQGDEPFIPPALIDDLIKDLKKNKLLLMNTACVNFNSEDDFRNPSHVKVVCDKDGFALYFSRAAIPFNRDAVKCERLRHIGIYGFRREFLLKYSSMEKSMLEKTEMLEQLRALENGIKIKVLHTDYNPISIDTQEDLEVALKFFKNSGVING